MTFETINLTSSDNVKINVLKWLPDKGAAPRAVIQIAHGMAEHAARYDDFAMALTREGFVVYANDHRGHGQTAPTAEDIGFFAEANGWQRVVDDMHAVTRMIKNDHPDLPVFLFGHSMGSMLSRTYIYQYGDGIHGAVLSGTAGPPGVIGVVGLWVAKTEKLLRGSRKPSNLMNFLSFGSFNNSFKPTRTDFDWLSRDEKEVDKYVEDPLCGAVFSVGFFNDMLYGILEIHKKGNIERIPKDLPIFLFSGSRDPVGNNGKGIEAVHNGYQKAGIRDVRMKLYEDGRHEMLNEINKQDVYQDVIAWVTERL